jgi:hypothetical protein
MRASHSLVISCCEWRDPFHRVLTEVTSKMTIENLLLVMITRVVWLVQSWGIGRDHSLMVHINTNKSPDHRSGVEFVTVVMQEARWRLRQEDLGKRAKELKERSGIRNHQC